MSQRKDDPAAPQDPAQIGHAPGRVEIDNRGRSVWRWAKDGLDSTSILLKRLDNKDLSLEPTRKIPIVRGADRAAGKGAAGKTAPAGKTAHTARGQRISLSDLKKGSGGGFDPYNSR
jgi:hypothetical protein